MPSLVASTGQLVDLPFKQVTIGSDPQCDIPMRADLGIAFRHVVLNVTPTSTWLQAPDLNQPVIVNGVRLVSSALRDGDVLTLGQISLTFRAPPPPEGMQAPTHEPALVSARNEDDPPTSMLHEPPIVTAPKRTMSQPVHIGTYRGQPVSITPNQAIGLGFVVLLVGLMGLYLYYDGMAQPLMPEQVKFLSVELVKSRQVQKGRNSYDTLLDAADGSRFKLGPDRLLNLATMNAPVIARIGITMEDNAAVNAGSDRYVDVVTMDINGMPYRTLKWHNELKARQGTIALIGSIIFGLGGLWGIMWGFEQRELVKKGR